MNAALLPFRAEDVHTIPGKLRLHALERADSNAFQFLDARLCVTSQISYGELDRRAALIAAQLRAAGCSGKPVLLAYPSCLEFVPALFGCFYAGSTAVTIPIPVMEPQRALERALPIMEDAEPCAVLTLSDRPAALPHERNLAGASLIATNTVDPDGPQYHGDQPDPSSVALLQYTSGTTGTPRGVIISHANLMANQQVLTEAFNISSEDRAVCWLPLYHDMGLIGAVLQTVFVGGSCALMSPLTFLQRPMRWLEAIGKFRATIGMAPNFAFELCARRAGATAADLDLSSWRLAICGGEPVREEILTRFADFFAPYGFVSSAFAPCYGLAESTLLATSPGSGDKIISAASPNAGPIGVLSADRGSNGGRVHVCCGKPAKNHEIAIVNPESRQRVPNGDEGEIWLRGPSVAKGYWRKDEQTVETFFAEIRGEPTAGGWLRTGDLGFVGVEGLFVTGRRKDLIILRGANIDPLDVEMLARGSHEAVTNSFAAAFGIEGDETEAVVLMLEVDRSIMRSREVEPVIEAVTRALNRTFGFGLHDLVLVAPGSLPRTTSGKIQRHLCRQRYEAGEIRPIAEYSHPALRRAGRRQVADRQC
jgi:acyl-CoA synthetase (AMP-forming)/AMP-acid ligase II